MIYDKKEEKKMSIAKSTMFLENIPLFFKSSLIFEDKIESVPANSQASINISFSPYYAKIMAIGFVENGATPSGNVRIELKSQTFLNSGWGPLAPASISNFGSIYLDPKFANVAEMSKNKHPEMHPVEEVFTLTVINGDDSPTNIRFLILAELYTDYDIPEPFYGKEFIGRTIIEKKITSGANGEITEEILDFTHVFNKWEIWSFGCEAMANSLATSYDTYFTLKNPAPKLNSFGFTPYGKFKVKSQRIMNLTKPIYGQGQKLKLKIENGASSANTQFNFWAEVAFYK